MVDADVGQLSRSHSTVSAHRLGHTVIEHLELRTPPL